RDRKHGAENLLASECVLRFHAVEYCWLDVESATLFARTMAAEGQRAALALCCFDIAECRLHLFFADHRARRRRGFERVPGNNLSSNGYEPIDEFIGYRFLNQQARSSSAYLP